MLLETTPLGTTTGAIFGVHTKTIVYDVLHTLPRMVFACVQILLVVIVS